jgi:hypothetical protein
MMAVYLHSQLNELRMWGEAFGGEPLPFGVQMWQTLTSMVRILGKSIAKIYFLMWGC